MKSLYREIEDKSLWDDFMGSNPLEEHWINKTFSHLLFIFSPMRDSVRTKIKEIEDARD